MRETDIHRRDENLLFQHYLVVFIDILGQRRGLREITNLPTKDGEKDPFVRKLKETFGKVDALRGAFRNFFETAESSSPNTSLVPPQYRDEFISSQKSETYFYGFSDSIIIAVPLMSDDDNCTAMNGVYSALVAASGIGLIALSSKIALRGGIDVGIATQIEGKEIYGPALERAYFLESNLAECPRFLVGKELSTYLHWVESQVYKTRMGEVSKAFARLCREMIIQDMDGRLILDFMGARAKEAADASIGLEVVKSARDFVLSEYETHVHNGNDKLSSRYFRLLRYIDSRARMWGVE